jgi:hypothetical protein
VEPDKSAGGAGRDRSWLWLLAGGIVVMLLAVVGGLQLVTGVAAKPDRAVDAATDPATDPATTDSSATGEPAAGGPSGQVKCWDGTGARATDECSLPAGAAGLAWVFPHLSSELCDAPSSTGTGVVLGVVCTTFLRDGTEIHVGYLQWETVQAGVDFYEGQQLVSSDGAGFRGWTGTVGDTFTSALMYVDAPFSETVLVPTGAAMTSEDIAMLAPRPADQLRGAPLG